MVCVCRGSGAGGAIALGLQRYQWGSSAPLHPTGTIVYTEQQKSSRYACCEKLTVNAKLLQSESALSRYRQQSFEQPFYGRCLHKNPLSWLLTSKEFFACNLLPQSTAAFVAPGMRTDLHTSKQAQSNARKSGGLINIHNYEYKNKTVELSKWCARHKLVVLPT